MRESVEFYERLGFTPGRDHRHLDASLRCAHRRAALHRPAPARRSVTRAHLRARRRRAARRRRSRRGHRADRVPHGRGGLQRSRLHGPLRPSRRRARSAHLFARRPRAETSRRCAAISRKCSLPATDFAAAQAFWEAAGLRRRGEEPEAPVPAPAAHQRSPGRRLPPPAHASSARCWCSAILAWLRELRGCGNAAGEFAAACRDRRTTALIEGPEGTALLLLTRTETRWRAACAPVTKRRSCDGPPRARDGPRAAVAAREQSAGAFAHNAGFRCPWHRPELTERILHAAQLPLLALIVLLLSSRRLQPTKECGRSTIPARAAEADATAWTSAAPGSNGCALATIRLSELHGLVRVSPSGLILTNHHCSGACLDEHSTKDKSLVSDGFLAREPGEGNPVRAADRGRADGHGGHHRARSHAATGGLDDKAANDKRKSTLTQLEQACEQASASDKSGPLKCETVEPVRGRPVLAVQVQALRRRAPGVCTGERHRRVRRRPGQLPVPALVPGHVGAARLRARRQARRHAQLPAIPSRRARSERAGVRLRPPGQHATPAHRGGTEDLRDVDLPRGCCATRSCAAATSSIGKTSTEAAAHHRGSARRPAELNQGAAQAARCAAG